MLVLDAGTGIRQLAKRFPPDLRRVDILLTHFHLDHIQGLGFFSPLFRTDIEVHIWAPAPEEDELRAHLTRYLSPPFFPVQLDSLPCSLHLHPVPCVDAELGEARVTASTVCHPGATVGYRIQDADGTVLTFIPDHEPALGALRLPVSQPSPEILLACGADLLIHDCQYTETEYALRRGWGHSTYAHAFEFAARAEVRRLMTYHHDPDHRDQDIDAMLAQEIERRRPPFAVTPGIEGAMFNLAHRPRRASSARKRPAGPVPQADENARAS